MARTKSRRGKIAKLHQTLSTARPGGLGMRGASNFGASARPYSGDTGVSVHHRDKVHERGTGPTAGRSVREDIGQVDHGRGGPPGHTGAVL